MAPALIILFVIAVVLVIRLGAGSMDRDRIREHIERQGGRVIGIQWAPFGLGWFGSKNERIYEVDYEDSSGYIHRAYCKTSMWAGVYWTEDQIVHRLTGSSKPELSDLAEENRRLREELEQLKRSAS